MKVVNKYEKIAENWYSSTVSIQGTVPDLNQVKYVTYFLHESFPNRKIVSTNPINNFAKKLQGWGEFLLSAEATMKNMQVLYALIWLDLGFAHTLREKNEYDGTFSETKRDTSHLLARKDPSRKEPERASDRNFGAP